MFSCIYKVYKMLYISNNNIFVTKVNNTKNEPKLFQVITPSHYTATLTIWQNIHYCHNYSTVAIDPAHARATRNAYQALIACHLLFHLQDALMNQS